MNKEIVLLGHSSIGEVEGRACCTMTARPQCSRLKPARLYVPLDVAQDFVLIDVRVGNKTMFVQSQELSLYPFCYNDGLVMGNEFPCDVVETSQDLVMMVRSLVYERKVFRATWTCVKVEDSHPIRIKNQFRNVEGAKQYEMEETDLKDRPISKISTAVSRREHPGFGWDPGYGDD